MAVLNRSVQEQCDELKVGDRVQVEHKVTAGQDSWTAKISGTVLRVDRHRHGLHFARNSDDKIFKDEILLEMSDGELTAVTVDEYTTIRHV